MKLTDINILTIGRFSLLALLLCTIHSTTVQGQNIFDDFEGEGTITNWFGDDCIMNNSFSNPYLNEFNSSLTVLRYEDIGGQYANIRFQQDAFFDLQERSTFKLKIFIPSSGISGKQNNQISLKLQNGDLPEPWTTQSEIIKSLSLDLWQTIQFDFSNDPFINFEPSSPIPTERQDFNRVVIQINGENNNDVVLAFIDDVEFVQEETTTPIYDRLIWADEFDTDGPVDITKWHHQTQLPNGNSWWNGEIQHYTNREENAFIEDGILHVTAKREIFTDQGVSKQYTSARLNSKFAFQYGRIEVRAKLPAGDGTWPAIWTLGKNINEDGAYWDQEGFGTVFWPACGEIDIMEHWGHNQNFVQSAIHSPSSFGNTQNKGGRVLNTSTEEFHIYAVDWYPDHMTFTIDDVVHYTYAPEVLDNNTWPFDAEQYILLNFAILPNVTPGFFEDALEVDYVRVYQESSNSTDDQSASNIEFEIYPNPSKEFVTVSYTLITKSKLNLSILDMQGREIRSIQKLPNDIGENKYLLPTSGLSPGNYFITLTVNGQRKVLKLLVY